MFFSVEVEKFSEMRVQIVLAWQCGMGWTLHWKELVKYDWFVRGGNEYYDWFVRGGNEYASC